MEQQAQIAEAARRRKEPDDARMNGARKKKVHVFQRAQIELEVFHSKEYHRTTSRCSHHVCYQLKDDAPSTKRFGRVVRYYKMDAFLGTSLSSTVRFCEMDSFEVTTTPADATATKRACCSAGPRDECELTSSAKAS